MVFKALPGVCSKGLGGRSTLWGEVGESSIVRLAVIHQNFVLATNAEVLALTLGRIGHGNERDMTGGKGSSGFARKGEMLVFSLSFAFWASSVSE